MSRSVPLLLLLLLTVGCSNDQTAPLQSTQAASGAPSAPTTAQAKAEAAEPFLVFFLDPNGGPCRMQDSILKGMATEFEDKVNLRYVQTTVPEDMDIFYAYGIRGLPTILLVDASGKEIKRLPPGVKSADDIRTLLDALPAS